MPSCLESGGPRRGPLCLEDESLHLQNIGNYESTKDVIPKGLNVDVRISYLPGKFGLSWIIM